MLSFMRQAPGFYRQTAQLTIPIVLQNIITSTLAMADTFMVGLLGEAQMAALTLANIPVFVITLFLFGTQSGSSILISQYWGKQDIPSIQRVLGISWWLTLLVPGTFALVFFLFPYEFMSLFGNDPEVVALAAGYGKIIGFSYLLNGFTLMYAGAHRSMGSPKLGMYLLGISMVLNIFLNWVFIYGNLGMPAMGVQGAAMATLVARSVEVLVMIGHICKTKKFRLNLAIMIAPGREMLQKYKKVCTPVVLSETAWGFGTSLFPTVMGHMDGSTEILAAYAIATNIERLIMVVGFGIGASTGILVGNAVGAGLEKEKVLDMGKCLGLLGFLCGLCSGGVLLLVTFTLLPNVVAPIFLLSPEATEIAQIMSVSLAVMMAARTFNTICVVGIFRGGGDSGKSMFVDLASLWFVAIPLTILTGLVWHLPILWVVVAMKTEDLFKTGVALWFLRSPHWIRDLTGNTET